MPIETFFKPLSLLPPHCISTASTTLHSDKCKIEMEKFMEHKLQLFLLPACMPFFGITV